jgi:hypothetical protein
MDVCGNRAKPGRTAGTIPGGGAPGLVESLTR